MGTEPRVDFCGGIIFFLNTHIIHFIWLNAFIAICFVLYASFKIKELVFAWPVLHRIKDRPIIFLIGRFSYSVGFLYLKNLNIYFHNFTDGKSHKISPTELPLKFLRLMTTADFHADELAYLPRHLTLPIQPHEDNLASLSRLAFAQKNIT